MGKKKAESKQILQKQMKQKKAQQKKVQEIHQPESKQDKNNFKERFIFFCAYFLSPTISILISYFYVRSFFINRMVTMKMNSLDVLNSENAINNVIAPFITDRKSVV